MEGLTEDMKSSEHYRYKLCTLCGPGSLMCSKMSTSPSHAQPRPLEGRKATMKAEKGTWNPRRPVFSRTEPAVVLKSARHVSWANRGKCLRGRDRNTGAGLGLPPPPLPCSSCAALEVLTPGIPPLMLPFPLDWRLDGDAAWAPWLGPRSQGW